MLHQKSFRTGLSLITISVLTACGGGSDSPASSASKTPTAVTASDTTPDQFSFAAVTDVAPSSDVLSAKIVISGIDTNSDISVVNGLYSVNGAAYSATSAKVSNGDVVQLKHTSANDFSESTETTVTIGGVSAKFVSTTYAKDSTPTPFALGLKREVPIGQWATSKTLVVEGLNTEVTATIGSGEFSINDGPYTTQPQQVGNGDTITVRHKTPLQLNATTTSLLTVGDNHSTFASITQELLPVSGNTAIQLDFPGLESGTDLTEITYQGIATSSKKITNIKVNSVPAAITQNSANKVAWSAKIPLNKNADTLVSISVQDEDATTTTQDSRVSNSPVTTFFTYNFAKDSLIGLLKSGELIELDLSNGISRKLKDNYSAPRSKYVWFRQQTNSLVWMEADLAADKVQIKQEPLIESSPMVLYEEPASTLWSSALSIQTALTPSQNKMLFSFTGVKNNATNPEDTINQIRVFDFLTSKVKTVYQFEDDVDHHVHGLAADESFVYVVDRFNFKNRLLKIDMSSGEAIQVASLPGSLSVYPTMSVVDNKLYISNPSSDNTIIFDIATQNLDTIQYQDNGINIQQEASSFYDSKRNRVLIGEWLLNGLFSADLSTRSLSTIQRAGIGIGEALVVPSFIQTAGKNKAYVLDGNPIDGQGHITEIDLTTGDRQKLLSLDYEDQAFNKGKSFNLRNSTALILTDSKLLEVSLLDHTIVKKSLPQNLNYAASHYDSVADEYYVLTQSGDSIVAMDRASLATREFYKLPTALNNISGLAFDKTTQTFYFTSNTAQSLTSIQMASGTVSNYPNCTASGQVDDYSADNMYHNPNLSPDGTELITAGLNALNLYNTKNTSCKTVQLYSQETLKKREGLFYGPIDAIYDYSQNIIGGLSSEIFRFNPNTQETVNIAGGVNGSSNVNATDNTPNLFSFDTVLATELSAYVVSNTVTIEGISDTVDISVIGGEFSINNSTFGTDAATVKAGDKVVVRHFSSDQYQTKTESRLTVGNVSALFESMTKAEQSDVDQTPDPIYFATLSDVEPLSTVESSLVTISGISADISLTVLDGEYSKNGAAYTSSVTTVKNGDTLKLRHTSAEAPETLKSTWITLAEKYQYSFNSITKGTPVQTPDPFNFETQQNVDLTVEVISNEITISGIEGAAVISVENGQYSINGAEFTALTGEVNNGDKVRLKHISADTHEVSVSSQLIVGNTSASFTSVTKPQPADVTPDPISFTPIENAKPSTLVESNQVTITGIDKPVNIAVQDGEYKVNDGDYTSTASSVSAGDTVQVRHTTSAETNTSVTTVVTVGDLSANFSSTTGADNTPDDITFTTQSNVDLSSVITSNEVTISGIEGEVNVTANNAEVSLNGAEFSSAEIKLSNGDKIRVRHTSSDQYSTQVESQITIGDKTFSFKSVTKEQDIEPDSVEFVSQTDVELASVITSNEVVIAGVDGNVAITVNNGEYSVNGAEFSASAGVVTNGDKVKVRHTSSSEASTSVESSIGIGSSSFSFVSTTKAN